MGSDNGLEHDYVKAGFALSVNPMVWEYIQANDRIDGKVRHALERLVRKMHVHPNPNSKVGGMQERGLLIYIGRSLDFTQESTRRIWQSDTVQAPGGKSWEVTPVALKIFRVMDQGTRVCGLLYNLQEWRHWAVRAQLGECEVYCRWRAL